MSDVWERARDTLHDIGKLDEDTKQTARLRCASFGKNPKEILMFLDMLNLLEERE